jgi:hypothetical protein
VRTQAPYAITTATAAVVLGYLPSLMLDWWNVWWALGSAVLVLGGLLLTVGRTTPDAPVPPAGTDAGAADRVAPRAPAVARS